MHPLPTRSELAQRVRTFEGRFLRALIMLTVVGFAALAIGGGVGTADTQSRGIGGFAFGVALLAIIAGAFS